MVDTWQSSIILGDPSDGFSVSPARMDGFLLCKLEAMNYRDSRPSFVNTVQNMCKHPYEKQLFVDVSFWGCCFFEEGIHMITAFIQILGIHGSVSCF